MAYIATCIFFADKFATESVTVFPSRIDHRGEHASYNLLSSEISDDDQHSTRHYFKLEVFGRHFILNLSDSAPFISSHHAVEYQRDGQVARVRPSLPSSTECHLSGTAHEVDDNGHEVDKGWVAVSNCKGLVITSRLLLLMNQSPCLTGLPCKMLVRSSDSQYIHTYKHL